MSKARSGLSTVKRDWDDIPSSSPEVVYDWGATQRPVQPQQKTQQTAGSSAPLTGQQKRLRDIQEALAGMHRPPSSGSSSQNKRESPTDSHGTAPPEKRRRLPPGWEDSLSMPSLSSSSSKSTKSSGSSQTIVATPPEPKAIASIFLSQEQTKILKLVQDGDSVFYTGSAGMLASLIISVGYHLCRDWKIGSPARDYQNIKKISIPRRCGHNGFHWCVIVYFCYSVLRNDA